MSFLLPAGIVCLALALVVYFHRRKRAAETSASQSNAMLSDFMNAEMMMKSSAMEGYKAMLRQPNPRAAPPPFEATWEGIPKRRRF